MTRILFKNILKKKCPVCHLSLKPDLHFWMLNDLFSFKTCTGCSSRIKIGFSGSGVKAVIIIGLIAIFAYNLFEVSNLFFLFLLVLLEYTLLLVSLKYEVVTKTSESGKINIEKIAFGVLLLFGYLAYLEYLPTVVFGLILASYFIFYVWKKHFGIK